MRLEKFCSSTRRHGGCGGGAAAAAVSKGGGCVGFAFLATGTPPNVALIQNQHQHQQQWRRFYTQSTTTSTGSSSSSIGRNGSRRNRSTAKYVPAKTGINSYGSSGGRGGQNGIKRYEGILSMFAAVATLYGFSRDVKSELKKEMGEVKSDLKKEISEVKSDINSMKAQITTLQSDFSGMKSAIDGMSNRISDMNMRNDSTPSSSRPMGPIIGAGGSDGDDKAAALSNSNQESVSHAKTTIG